MDAVDHQVDVRVGAVAVGDHDGLVLPQAEVLEKPVRDAYHQRAVHRVGRVEADREVVDGGAGGGCAGHHRHHGGRVAHGGRPDVPGLVPGDAPLLQAVVAALQVRGQGGEAAPVGLVPDHRSLTAARISRSASTAAPAFPPSPAATATSITS